MSYVRNTGRDYARKRRQRRSQVILILVATLVVCGFGYAVAYAIGVAPGSQFARVGPSCTTTVTRPPQSRVMVNVYNASSSQGEASALRRSLLSRNFRIGAVSNDPYKEKISGVGEVRVGDAGLQFAKTYVLPLVPDVKLVVDGRTDTSVDIVIGNQFTVPPSITQTEQQASNCKTTTV